MNIRDIEYVKEQVKSFLPEFLENHGRKVHKGNFACPNEDAHKNQHKDPTAGFPDKHSRTNWNCFGCGAKGDIFHAAHYLEGREIQGAGFIETLLYLADMFHVIYEIDERQENIIQLNELVARTIKIRQESKKAIEFLQKRNLTDAAAEFGLGYCTWQGLTKTLYKHYDAETVNLNLDKYLFDDKLIIPIRNENGQLVGFAGRRFDDQKPKYVNSRSSDLYQKGKLLYNLYSITSQEVYIVEGYPDVWRLHLNGFPAAAPCGTAFTKEHLDLLHERAIKKVIFCFDGDKAGLEAQEKVRKIIGQDARFEFSFMTLPKGKDPDELIKEKGKDAFESVEREEIKKPIDILLGWTAERIIDLEMGLEEGQEDAYKIAWPEYMKKMDGVKKGMHLVGGLSNVGKTTFMLQIYEQLATHNSNLIPVFFSIDDDWQIPYLRLIASEMQMSINDVRNYQRTRDRILRMAGQQAADNFITKRRAVANRIYQMVKQAPIFDITKASKLNEFEDIIKTIKEHTGKQVAIFVDNFHKIRDSGFKSPNERFTHISEELKRITVEQELVTFATVEFRKLNHNGRPTLDDIKESVDIVYDSNAAYILHNDLHSKQGETDLKFEQNGITYPVIEMSVQKNKLSGFKGKIFYKMIPEQAVYMECSAGEQIEYSRCEIRQTKG